MKFRKVDSLNRNINSVPVQNFSCFSVNDRFVPYFVLKPAPHGAPPLSLLLQAVSVSPPRLPLTRGCRHSCCVTKISPCRAAGGDERIYSFCKFFCFFVCLLDRGHIKTPEHGCCFFYSFSNGFVCPLPQFSAACSQSDSR